MQATHQNLSDAEVLKLAQDAGIDVAGTPPLIRVAELGFTKEHEGRLPVSDRLVRDMIGCGLIKVVRIGPKARAIRRMDYFRILLFGLPREPTPEPKAAPPAAKPAKARRKLAEAAAAPAP